MLAFLTTILPFIWHYGLGAVLLGAAVVLYMLTAFKREAIYLAAAVAVGLVVYSVGLTNGIKYEHGKLVEYQLQVQTEIANEVARQMRIANAAVVALETELTIAERSEAAATQAADALRNLIASRPVVPGRGATEADLDALN
ncbi:MAG: hypothetical protein Q8P46_15010 [Hyphomicrobiales bacterium]|nr:hypothetical protein [Hyphomicrobiales bacterium]